MTEWTKSAREELDRYFERARVRLAASEADPAEVLDDLRRHIDEDLVAAKIDVVTEGDVRRILARLGLPEALPSPSPAPSPAPSRTDVSGGTFDDASAKAKVAAAWARRRLPGFFLLAFGVLLPVVTLAIEVRSHFCAGTFFDPIPTVGHVALVAFAPLANFLAWLAIRRGWSEHRAKLGWANGAAVGVSLFYTLLFLPLLPLAVPAVICYGMGLLPLAPLFSFIAAIACRRHLGRLRTGGAPAPLPGLWRGMAIALFALTAVGAPETLTRLGLQMAASDSPDTSVRGLRLLRAAGDEGTLLRACYVRPGRATDLIGFLFALSDPVKPDEARRVFYRVTGKTFDAVPPPAIAGEGRWIAFDEGDFDPEPGGGIVAGRVKGLSLAGSRLDGSIDADAAVGYVEWTLVFRNDSTWRDAEARAQVRLPPGAVVSRLTLWVQGEEREAAFAARSQAQEAYRRVVQRRRDPVLVTTAGSDRVLLQCFPVPQGGGEMKVRLGVTVPLQFEDRERVWLRLPCFLDRNFSVRGMPGHSVWVESKKRLQGRGGPLQPEHPKENVYAVRGMLTDEQLGGEAILAARAGGAASAWTADPVDPSGPVIRQTLEERETRPPRRVVVVVDGSIGMRDVLPKVASALTKMPEGIEFAALFADDEIREMSWPVQNGSLSIYRGTADRLARAVCEGGQDNVSALVRGWDGAAGGPDAALVWIHGPQPMLLQTTDALRQRWERRPGNPSLYDIQVRSGPSRLSEKLDGLPAVETVLRGGDVKGDLERLFSGWHAASKRIVPVRERMSRERLGTMGEAKETSAHLAKLWARDEVLTRVASRDPAAREEAVGIATRYQLVTPVSGAVVLETQEQYQQAGLQPVDPRTVPTIPEPETWMLLAASVLVMAWVCRRRGGECRTS